ncbi:hypothetical protein PRSM4_237 [Prochlorococcus phage P-RSM4]|jgi:hypothetical protein|uniref:Uncharacterized protein n=2 Tax=Thaumasvirus stim4 TaxID=2734148 RepID=E3SMC1_9CAUD|nr:hypothetical protein PRSM4_237 [Prochlorococcus phage P-RSM4]ADO98619.1 hypothetical protein PRSM4_237 [Prochlorococcus phage P-RSM4]
MERSNTEERQAKQKMSVYFDRRKALDAEEKKKNEEAAKAVARVVQFFVQPAIVMLLWNWLMPGLFGLATIGYLKAFGLYLMSKILFGKYE